VDATSAAGGPATDCVPGFVAGIGMNTSTQVLSGRNTVVLADARGRSVRLVHLNIEPPPSLPSTRLGYSVGHWNGDTLVVETTGLSSGRTVVERFRVTQGGQVESIVDGRAALANGPYALRTLEPSCSAPALAVDATRRRGSVITIDAHPSLEGSWTLAAPVLRLKTTAGRAPPLLTAAGRIFQEQHTQWQADAAARDKASACRVLEEPRASYQSPGLDIVLGTDTIFVGYAPWARVRFVPLGEDFDGAVGGRIGRWRAHWDHEALVLEGEGFDATTALDATGLQHSAQLRVVQRLTLKQNGRTLEVRSVFTDPATFSRSWETIHTYRRQTRPPDESPGC